MAGMFDDLIPKKPAAPASGMFDDLIPKASIDGSERLPGPDDEAGESGNIVTDLASKFMGSLLGNVAAPAADVASPDPIYGDNMIDRALNRAGEFITGARNAGTGFNDWFYERTGLERGGLDVAANKGAREAQAVVAQRRMAENARRAAAGLPSMEEERRTQLGNRIADTLRGGGEAFNALVTPEQQLADKRLGDAAHEGILPMLGEVARHPIDAAVSVVPSTAAFLVPAGVAGRLAKTVDAGAAGAAGVTAAGTTAALSTADQTANAILTNPEIAQSPEYQALVAQGASDADARAILAQRAYNTALPVTGAINAATMGFAPRLNVLEQLAAGGGLPQFAKGRVAAALLGTLAEGVTEAPQGGGEQLAQNLGELAAGVGTPGDVMHDVPAQSAMEALASAPGGAVAGWAGAPGVDEVQALKDKAADPNTSPPERLAALLDLMNRGESVPAPAAAPPLVRPAPASREVSTPLPPKLAPQPRQTATVAAEPPLLDRPPPEAVRPEPQAPSTAPAPAQAVSEPIDLTPSERSRRAKIGPTAITYSVTPDAAKVILVSTPPKERGQGGARAAMQAFTAAADAKGMPVELVVAPLSKDGDPARLQAFYSTLGFEPSGTSSDGSTIMRREPAAASTSSAMQPPEAAPAAPLPAAKKPKTLLHSVAKVGLNREAFRQAGIHPDYFLARAGIGYVFRKEGGLTPDALVETMQQDGFLPPDAPADVNDAVNLLQEALDGRDVFSYADADAAAAYRAQQRAEIERDLPDIHPDDMPEALRLYDEAEEARDAGEPPEEFFARYEGEPQPEVSDAVEAGTGQESDRAGVPEAAAAPAQPARGQGALFPPGNAREEVAAAQRARDDERNGRTGTGRTDMLAGKGELFAGPAPEQARIEASPPERGSTSLKNEVMEAEREFRGDEPLPKPPVDSNEDALDRAKDTLKANPSRGDEIVAAINGDVHGSISHDDQAVLLVHKQATMQARDAAAERAGNDSLTPEQRAVAKREFDRLETDLHAIDEATKAAGVEWGRLGQFRQRLLAADFTFEALERKQRAIMGRPLSIEESNKVKEQAEQIATLQREKDAAQKALDEATERAAVEMTYRSLVDDMAKALRGAETRKRPILETLKKAADESRAALAAIADVPSNRKQSGAVIDPRAFFHLARIGAYHVANGVSKLADFVARMKADLSERFDAFSDAMPDVFAAAKAQVEAARKAGKEEATPASVVSKIEDGNITHRDVYNLARAHVIAGVHGESAVMKAVHADLKKLQPDITERDVRRLFSDYGKAKFPSKEADKVELRELRALVQLQESIDRLREGRDALKSGQQRDKATQAIREKRRQLNALLREQERKHGASPEKLASYQDARITNLKNQIEDLTKELATGEKPTKPGKAPEPNAEVKRLTAIRDDLRKQLKAIEDARNPPKSPEQRYQESRAKSLRKQLEEVKARIAAGNYAKAVRPPPKELNAANKKAAYDLAKAKQEVAIKQYEMQMAARPLWRKALSTGAETLNLARAVMTSIDLSAVLRQGGFIVLGHPGRGARSILPMLRALTSEKRAFEVDDEIANRPNFELYKKAGLYLSEQNNHLPSKMEEAYLSRWLQKTELSGGKVKRAAITAKNVATAPIRASGRAFTTFLNKLRADSFDEMAATLSANGELTLAEAKALANYINVATGRGKIGTKQQAAVGLNTVFFAPKLVASRFNLLGGQPLYGGTNRTRALVALDYARFMAGVATVFALAALAHDDDDGPLTSLDPRSADFLKIRFGKTFIDPLTGLAQVTTFMARMATGEKKTTTGKLVPLRDDYRFTDYAGPWAGTLHHDKVKYREDTMFDVLLRFARTKFAPIPGAIATAMSKMEDVTGQKVTKEELAAGLVTPLSFRNVYDLMREHGVAGGPAILALEMLGMGVQYRKPDDDADKPDDDKRKTKYN